MKLKKLLVTIIVSILILTFSVSVLATSDNKVDEQKLENEVSNSVENETQNEVQNKVENKVENEVSNSVKNEIKNEAAKNETSKTETTKEPTTRKKLVNEEVAVFDDNIKYKNTLVNGNVFLAGNKVVLSSSEVNGDVMIFATEVEIKDCEISGSVYIASEDILIDSSEMVSVYLAGDNVEIGEDAKISRELRVVGATTVTLSGEVGRDFSSISSKIVITDNAKVLGESNISADTQEISEKAVLSDLNFEKIDYIKTTSASETFITYLIEKGTEIAVILLITIFVLGCLPKFVDVNSSLRLRDFFREFFTGLLEFIVVVAISLGLCYLGYSAGYGLILLNLLILFSALGKVIFIISFAVRMSCNPEKVSKIKAFFATALVAVILAAIEMISLLGTVGVIICIVINIALAITGLGSMFRVLFTSKKKMEKLGNKKIGNKNVVVQEVIVEKDVKSEPEKVIEEVKEEAKEEPIKENVKEEKKEEASVQEELKEEIKKEVEEEVKEEVKELKEENKKKKKEE